MAVLRSRRLSSVAASVTLSLILGSLSVASCGGDGKRAPNFNGTDEGGASPRIPTLGGETGQTGGTGTGGEPTSELEPTADLRTPESGEVFNAELSTTCAVLPGAGEDSSPIDPASVGFSLVKPDALSVPLAEAEGTPGADDEYGATLDLQSVPSGSYLLRCSVTDEAGLSGTDEIEVLVDHGPGIEPISPIAEGFLSRSGQHDFVVRIRPAELFDGDTGSELAALPEIDIDGKTFTLEAKDGEADVYWLTGVDFEDESVFPQPPPGATTISVTAENERGIKGRLQYPIYIDGQGPLISVASPADGTIIGSRAIFTFKASDDYSGVDWSTLVVEAKDTKIPFDPDSPRWSQDGDEAVLELDTTEYSVATQMSVNVTVSDRAGNPSLDGGESTYFLDQQPPVLALDPPNIRILVEEKDLPVCSHSFDPVGSIAVNHGDDTNNLAFFRALAWDATNVEQGQVILHYSGVDQESLRLWLAPAGELTVDTDGDGICDDISSDLLDIDTVEMDPIPAGGKAFNGDGTGDSTDPVMTGICDYSATPDTTAPDTLCSDRSDMSYSLSQTEDRTTPAIYATLVGDGVACTGDQQSISALVGNVEGWICAAVRATDAAGNQGVSAPIAVCVDNSEVPGVPGCVGAGPAGAPDCTDGCTPLTFPAGGLIIEP